MRKSPAPPLPAPDPEEIATTKKRALSAAGILGHKRFGLWKELPWEGDSYVGEGKKRGDVARRFEATCERCRRTVVVRQGEDGVLQFEGNAVRERCLKTK